MIYPALIPAGGRLRQEDRSEFEANLGYTARPQSQHISRGIPYRCSLCVPAEGEAQGPIRTGQVIPQLC